MRTLRAKRPAARAGRSRAKAKTQVSALRRAIGFLTARRWGKVVLAATGLLMIGSAGGFSAWHLGYMQLAGERADQLLRQGLLEVGLSVRSVTAAGREQTAPDTLLRAIDVSVGQSILHTDLAAVRARVARLPWVADVRVSRRLPDTIHVDVIEKRPLAIWQLNGKMMLVDRAGEVITADNLGAFARLPLVVGEGAATAAAELLSVLQQEPRLQQRVAAAVRVGQRRWNLRLQNGIDVRMPELDPLSAWRKLARYEATEGLLGRDVEIVDLRLPDQVVVRLGRGTVRRIGTPGREARVRHIRSQAEAG